MTTLHDRLAALADDVPVRPAEPDLWQRGRRLHRRRRLGTVVIVAVTCLLLASLGIVDWQQRRTPVQPASGDETPAIPDEFHEPSKWLPSTEGEPWDRLIAIVAADRGAWFDTRLAVVGVSAVTGEYRFLDLPDQALQGAEDPPRLSLSPDGRYVAYWYAEPSTIVPDDAGNERARVANGYAVYDVTRGETVLRESVDTPQGLFGESIDWADDHTVAFALAEVLEVSDDGSSSKGRPVRVHDLRDGSETEFPPRITDAAGGGWLIFGNGQLRSATGAERSARVAGARHGIPAINGEGTRVAALRQPGTKDGSFSAGDPNHLVVADIDAAGSPTRLSRIPGDASYDAVIGWRDDTTAVATIAFDVLESGSDGWIQHSGQDVVAVDIETGAETLLTTVPPGTQLAAGLLNAPVAERRAPPEPWSPWAKLWTTAAILVAGGAILLGWRRRVRP